MKSVAIVLEFGVDDSTDLQTFTNLCFKALRPVVNNHKLEQEVRSTVAWEDMAERVGEVLREKQGE